MPSNIVIDNKPMTLALNMIVRDEVADLKKALASVIDYVDEVVIGLGDDGSPEMEEFLKSDHRVTYFKFTWKNDWGYARNLVLDETKSDLILWLDPDDQFVNADKIKEVCESIFKLPQYGSVWCMYHYILNEKGESIDDNNRERIVRAGKFRWKDQIHETLQSNHEMMMCFTDLVWVDHHFKNDEERQRRGFRNAKLAKKIVDDAIAEERPLRFFDVYNLARCLEGIGDVRNSMDWYEKSIEASTDPSEECLALMRMIGYFRKYGENEKALDYSLRLIKVQPSWPDGYLGMGFTYFNMKHHLKAIEMLETALTKKVPYDVRIPIEKEKYTVRPYSVLSLCYFFTGDMEKTIEYADKCLALKEIDDIREVKLSAENCIKENKLIQSAIDIKVCLEEEGNIGKLKGLVKCLPKFMEDQPVFIYLRNKYCPSFEKNVVTIHCGDSVPDFGPDSIQQGIGGSEEAVIYLGRELSKLGWNVHVYCPCTRTGLQDGITWHNYWEYDPNAQCDIFIAWRQPSLIDKAPIKSSKFVWLHDVADPKQWDEDIIEKTERIIVLSKFHRGNLSFIEDEKKFLISSNGIIPEHFQGGAKSPFSFIYASCPSRGLECVLDNWIDIKTEFPLAVLHVYYGFDGAGFRDTKFFKDMKERLLRKMADLKKYSVIYHGKVGHLELADAFLNASYWLYPCFGFPEISCITAMKAQAAGCWPITTDLAALDETVQYGDKMHVEKFIPFVISPQQSKEWTDKVLERVKSGTSTREEMSAWAKDKFSWENVAKQWNLIFTGLK